MAKIGRNDPCPCGSGKKYKRCCGFNESGLSLVDRPDSVESGLADPSGEAAFDRRLMERTFADINRLLAGHEFTSPEELNAAIRELDLDQIHWKARTPLDEAQNLMYDAWEADGDQRALLARKALTISPDCADAYSLLADETAKSGKEALDLYRRALAAGERALGPDRFRDLTGEFWGALETRPYMRARHSLANLLWDLGEVDEALDHCVDMLRLNPGDNQGVRYELLAHLLQLDLNQPASTLLSRYPGEVTAIWTYGRALLAFRTEGKTRSSTTLLEKAIKANPRVPSYLQDPHRLPRQLPDYIGIGDESEAVYCATELLEAWRSTPGAIEWMREIVDGNAAKQTAQKERVPKQLQAYFDAITEITDRVCEEHLTDEYRTMSRRLAAALCRKRPAPVTRGRIETWACGIVYAIGSVNFIFDKSSEPYFSAADLCAFFGVAATTGANKASEIRRMFNMDSWFSPEWELPSHRESNPMNWMVQVNGLLADARTLPRDLQEQAFYQGLIPYLPEPNH
jgi:tetratricopeptide (TPR) repeat protein